MDGVGADVPGAAARRWTPRSSWPSGRRGLRGRVVRCGALAGAADTIAASGLVNPQLGPGEFLENFAIWSEPIKATRTVRGPYPAVVEAPISMDDIARVAAALLVKRDRRTMARCSPSPGRSR